MRKAVVIFGMFIGAQVWAQCPPQSTLVFANGMFNPRKDAEESLADLTARVSETGNWKREHSRLAYNFDEATVLQLLEVYHQKSQDMNQGFWRWLTDWTNAPTWLKNEIQKAHAREVETNVFVDISEHASLYEHELGLDRSVVVVAHSQGNFFANSASLKLSVSHYPSDSHFKIISVATPSGFVNGNGPHFTLTSDWIIRSIPGSLPANVTNTSPKPGVLDHQFIKHYLSGVPTGKQIVDKVQSTFTALAEEAKETEGYNAECWKWFETLNLPKNNSKECVLKCASAKSDFSNFTCSTSCQEYCGCWIADN